jgi:hypothetical protein
MKLIVVIVLSDRIYVFINIHTYIYIKRFEFDIDRLFIKNVNKFF